MDTKSILPGERRETKINQAIKKADFLVAFLSGSSVDRRGVLRRELRLALDKWQEMLEEDIFLIPVKLECSRGWRGAALMTGGGLLAR